LHSLVVKMPMESLKIILQTKTLFQCLDYVTKTERLKNLS